MNELVVARKKQTIISTLSSLMEMVAARPERIFWTFIGVHLLLWTIIPALVCPNAPLDVIENYAWGHEWLLGTHKHPPMQTWWLEALAVLTGRAPWAHFFASQLAIVISFWAVWDVGRRMLGDKPALIGVLLLEGVIYYNFTSPEFNANILQLPFWALTGRSFYRAVKDNKLTDWLLLGLWSAGGLYSKYSTLLLLATLAIVMFAHKEGRKRLKSSGPYLALTVTALLFLPHIEWLLDHNFLPFDYANNQMHPMRHNIFLLLGLIGGQLAALMPAALLFFAVFSRRPADPKEIRLHSFDRFFLCAITFGPFFLTFLLALIAGFKIRDMWATPFWNFIGLWVMFGFPPKLARESMRRFACGLVLVVTFSLVGYGGSVLYGPYITHKTQRVHFPGQAFAQKMDDAWHEKYHRPLEYVIGDTWPAGNVAYYSPERPHVLMMGSFTISPWIDRRDLLEKGGIIVWCIRFCSIHNFEETKPEFIQAEFPQAKLQSVVKLPRQTNAEVEPVVLGWAILPPKKNGI